MGWRTVRPRWADGPPLYSKLVPERVSVGVGFKVERRTVRQLISGLYQRGCFSGLGSKVKLRTVRFCGADGPQANLKVVPETMLVSGGVELLTADGPPLGRGRSARA